MNRWGTTYTVATAAVMCLGQNSLTEPIPIQTGFELYISSFSEIITSKQERPVRPAT